MATEHDDIIRRWIECARQNHGTPEFDVSRAAFRALLSGDPPYPAVIAAITGFSKETVERLIRTLVAKGRMTVDPALGVVTGAGGLSQVESRHVMEMKGRRNWGWCALDAVGIPAALGLDADVRSVCTDSGESVRVQIRGGSLLAAEPNSVVISLLPPAPTNLMQGCCARIDFYEHPASVLDVMVPLTVDEAMALGRELWRDGVPL